MQIDMHYYGTYAIALAAGIPDEDARVIAYASQYMDDATSDRNGEHEDGGWLVTFTTAHHLMQSAQTMVRKSFDDQRKIWVPNHFVPGGAGNTFEERALCVMDSPIARAMFEEHLVTARNLAYGLELIGVAAHAYMDTFSHYGFSGFSSKYNKIRLGSIETRAIRSRGARAEVSERVSRANSGNLAEKYLTNVVSLFAQGGNAALGHGAVLTLPDLPYLRWEFSFEKRRHDGRSKEKRDNHMTYLLAAQSLHEFLSNYAFACYQRARTRPFAEIKSKIAEILSAEGETDARAACWLASGLIPSDASYDAADWEQDLKTFRNGFSSEEGIACHAYRFHQAAAYHRYYMLKDLLPRFGLAVY